MSRKNMMDKIDDLNVVGLLKVMELDADMNVLNVGMLYNKFMAGGADIVAQLLAGVPNFNIRSMYVEFENGSPSSIVEPAYTTDAGLEYYTGLATPKDYLRVPIATNPVVSSSDSGKYVGNQVTFFGITAGTTGVNGLAFSESAGSVAYGGALIASPELTVPTADKIFARTYWTDRLFPKHDGRQIGVQWTVRIVAND